MIRRIVAAALVVLVGCGPLVGIEEVTREPATVGGAGGTASLPPSAGPSCRACGDACVDPLTDAAHCGRCGVACGAGEACVAGVCGRRLHGSPSATSACFVGDDGVLRCWGDNRFGQLGRGTFTESEPQAAAFPSGGRFGVSDGIAICALDPAGAVRCGGGNLWGNLGNGTYGGKDECRGTPTCEALPTTTLLPLPADDVAVGGGTGTVAYSCARLADRGLACWGRGTERATPRVRLRDVAQVASGNGFTCALTFDGATYCFGGFLGVEGGPTLGDALPSPALFDFPHGDLIVAGARSVCTARGPGMSCFGANGFGQLGIGDAGGEELRSSTPVALPIGGSDLDIVQAVAGEAHGCVLRVDGVVLCWGEASVVGGGDAPPQTCLLGPCYPTPIVVLEEVREIAAGRDFTLALRRDGTLWGWGRTPSQSCVLVDEAGCATTGFGAPRELPRR